MTSSTRLCVMPVLLLSLLTSHLASGQAATGTPPFGSFANGGFDTVDLANLNVHFAVPILSKAGRGIPFHYAMDYESSIWVPTASGSSFIWQPVNTNWGWTALSEALTGTVIHVGNLAGSCFVILPDGQRIKETYPGTLYSGYKDPSGTVHPIHIELTGGSTDCNAPPVTSGSSGTTDGSGYSVTVTNSGANVTVKTRSGWTIPNPGTSNGTVIDANGNELSTAVNGATTTFTDTLGTTALTVNVASPTTTTFTYTAPSGVAAIYTFTYTSKTVQTNFGCAGISEFPATSENLLTGIQLPDSTTYAFAYEQTPGKAAGITTGRIASVTLPTGGIISYAYQGGNNGITCADGSTATLVRTTPDGTWNYAHTELSNQWDTSVTDPAGNLTSLIFQGVFETQRVVNQNISGTQTPIFTSVTCYNGNATNCPTTAVTLPITRRTTTNELPTSTGEQSKTDTVINSLGLPTEIDQYNYGAGAVGAVLQKTTITYNTTLGNNILDHPSSVVVTDANGNLLSSMSYTYDEGTPSPTSGTPQHVAITGSRGNLTTMTQSVSGSHSLSRHNSYYDTGTPFTATDVNGAQTTYNYGAGSCGFSFPDSITLPLSLSTSTTYSCTGGVAISSTDANGHQSFVNYASDPFFWRPNSSQDAAGALTTLTYTGATKIESVLSFNAGSSALDMLTTTDSVGRPLYTQKKQSPSSSNYDSVQQIYDVVHALTSTTVPYVGTAGQGAAPGGPAVTTNYDALGRPTLVTDAGGGRLTLTYTKNDVKQEKGPPPAGENTKAKQLEYDALGRLISVCEITGTTGSGACGQTSGGTGFLTTYSYSVVSGNPTVTVTQNAQAASNRQTRVYTYDLLGRLISEQNPESGSSTYTYDTADATCGSYSSPGDMVEKHDAAGNVTCTQFDAFHRQILMTYPSGPNATATPARFFQYDNPYFGSTGANIKGRLVAAGTCQSPTSCAGSSVTLLEFGYSPRGEVTDIWESTPNSGGMYHVQAGYWPNGNLNTLAGFLASGSTFMPTQTYSVDGEGRWQSVSASSGPNPVLSTTYNTASEISGIQYGSTDTDSFQYDNAGRMHNYTFTVNGSSEVGVPTWNGNGTLASLAITDPFNASDAQTCNYSYDDLARILSANCGAAWSQTFSYDVFGNLTKSGSLNWQPGYNLANNRYTLAGTAYDANGNLTNDTFRTYAWDSNGRPTSIGSKTMTYDAFGRMVEKFDGAFTQFVYSPSGSLLARMSAQSATSVRVPLPGSWAVYGASSSFNHYEHLDWLGNSRLSSSQSRTITSDIAYAPFGEPYASTATSGVSFTGMRSDVAAVSGAATNGLYDFLARELPPTQGRWLSPDPAGMGAVDFTNPQSFNRYAYVGNQALNFVDPVGLFGAAVIQASQSDWIWYASGGAGGGLAGDPFELAQVPVVVYGWTYGFINSNPGGAPPNMSYTSGSGTEVMSFSMGYMGYYWGAVSLSGIENPLLFSVDLTSQEDANRAFCAMYGECPLPTRIPRVTAVHPRDPDDVAAYCTVEALNENNGVGIPTDAPGTSDSLGTQTATTQSLGEARVGSTEWPATTSSFTLNPSAGLPSVSAGVLSAPGIFVQSSYQGCMAKYGY